MPEGQILLFPAMPGPDGRPPLLSDAALRGKLCFGGKEYQVSLWEEHTKKDPNKIFFKGAIRFNQGLDLSTITAQTPWQPRLPPELLSGCSDGNG